MTDSSMIRVGKCTTTTTSIDFPLTIVVDAPEPPCKPSKLAYYWRVMRWMWRHREEPNNRAKWRRMAKEIAC